MTAQEKIKEAEYDLNKLQNVPIDYIQYEVSAFLTSARSVLDHLLEDYRIRFGLGDIRYLNVDNFQSKARKLGNKPALHFIKWFQAQNQLIRENGRYGFLLSLRDINVHRRFPKRGFWVKSEGLIKGGDAVTKIPIGFPPLGKPMKAKTTSKSQKSEEVVGTSEWEITSGAFFHERPNDDLVSLCKEFLEAIKVLVLEAESKWGANL